MIPAQVIHHVPGRLRARLEPGWLDAAEAISLKRSVERVRGVKQARVSASTDSLIVEYDQNATELEQLEQHLRSANVVDLTPLDPDRYQRESRPPSEVTERIRQTFHEVDVRLSDMSLGRWDLRSVVPVAFGILAVRALLSNPATLAAAPWYVLAWYAFDSFWKLNHDREAAAASDARS